MTPKLGAIYLSKTAVNPYHAYKYTGPLHPTSSASFDENMTKSIDGLATLV